MLSPKDWKVESVFRLLSVVFLSLSVVGLASSLADRLFPGEGGEGRKVLIGVVGTLVFQGVALGLVGWFLHENRSTWGEAFGWGWVGLGRAAGLAAGLTVLVVPANLGLMWVSQRLMVLAGLDVKAQPTVEALQSAESVPELALMGGMALVTAPVVEEVLFRGILFPAIRAVGFPRLAWWLPSLLFAMTHASLVTMLPLTFFALVLTWLYDRTENLAVSIFTHCFFNAANFAWLIAISPHGR
jgi:membrane protease YdiL (CAAX protease family)